MIRPSIAALAVLAVAGVAGTVADAQEAAPPAGAAVKDQPARIAATVAILPFESDGIDPNVVQSVSSVFVSEARRIPGYKVLGPAELDAMVGAERLKKMAACAEMSCMTAIAGVLGADIVIKVSAVKAAGPAVFSVRLFDSSGRGGKPEIQFSKELPEGTQKELMEAVPQGLATVFPANAAIWGQGTPLQAPPPEKKAGPSVAQWVLIGGGAAVIVAGGVVNYLAKVDYDEWKNVPETDPKDKSLKESAELKQTIGFSLLGAGAAALAGGLIWYFVTKPADKPAVESGPISGMRLSPVFIGGYGAALSGSW